MSADVAQVDLKPFDLIDYDNYKDGGGSGKSYAPPPEGRYLGKVGQIQDDGTDVIGAGNSFGRTAEGYLKVELPEITLVDGPNPGYSIKFTRLSSKKYKGREGSQVFDFLRAANIAARPKNETELRQAIKLASGRTFQFALTWEAYNKDADETTKGMENFPLDAQDATKRQPFIVDNFDSTKRWWANGKVRYFISAIKS